MKINNHSEMAVTGCAQQNRLFVGDVHYPPYQRQWDEAREGQVALFVRLNGNLSRKKCSAYAWALLMGEPAAANAALQTAADAVQAQLYASSRYLWQALAEFRTANAQERVVLRSRLKRQIKSLLAPAELAERDALYSALFHELLCRAQQFAGGHASSGS